MSIICSICKELLLTVPKPNDTVVTTKCGHLFHFSCVNSFFEAEIGGDNGTLTVVSKSNCPSCQTVVLVKNLIQVYPADDDNDPFGKLLERCNTLLLENEGLKVENRRLKGQNEELRKLPGALILEDKKNKSRELAVEDVVVWFPDVEVEDDDYKPEAGVVKWIGKINEMLYSGIEFENPIGDENICDGKGKKLINCKANHGKLVPVNELIRSSDFYEQVVAGVDADLFSVDATTSVVKSSEPQILSQKTTNTFERQLNEFVSKLDGAAEEYRKLRDETKDLSSEEIIAIPSAIEDQLKRASELRSTLITNDKLIENLKKFSVEILQNEDITTQEISILKDGISLLEELKDNCKQNLQNLQFATALGHSQKVKSFLQAGLQWLKELEIKFDLLLDTPETSKLSTPELLRVKIDLDFRGPQIEHLLDSFNFFQSPGFKLRRNDHTTIKSALDTFEDLKTRRPILNNILLKDAHRIFKILGDWCERVHFALETEFGSQLKMKLEELSDQEGQIKQEIPKLLEIKNAFGKDSVKGVEAFSKDFEDIKARIDATSEELKLELKQLKSEPVLPRAYY